MKIQSFRIKNFRSIVDTGWKLFSGDNVTVLIGQNESGKTSILEALAKTFSSENISDDDKRIGDPLPEVYLKIDLDVKSLIGSLYNEGFSTARCEILKKYLKEKMIPVELKFSWDHDEEEKVYYKKITASNPQIDVFLQETLPNVEETSNREELLNESQELDEENNTRDEEDYITQDSISQAIYEVAPLVTLFNHETGLLPNQIDIVKNKQGKYVLVGQGSTAARNFLLIAGLDLELLVSSDIRTRESFLRKANKTITEDFAMFWSQTIGRKETLQLECALQTYGSEGAEKAGNKYLLFWINNGVHQLYPKQRSQGVRWFLSFYLQLKASKLTANKQVFLLDEPGANLHSKAQSDVIMLINKLSEDIPIVYTTHTSHMIEYDKLYRVLAIQRLGEEEGSPTEVKSAHELGTASSDTLSPVLTAMGTDLSSQEVIRKKNNVLLEEMSGFYYLTAFWNLRKEAQEAFFIAVSGVNKIPNFANMFLGWGLKYIVVVDDDKSGRGVYNQLKKEIFADDEALAKANMYKIKDCEGIEDIFSQADFKKYVLNNPDTVTSETNSNYLKTNQISKPMIAYHFLIKVRKQEITSDMLERDTIKRIDNLISEIKSRLINQMCNSC